VADVAHAIELCLERPEADGKVLNVGSGVPTSVLEIAEMLIQVFQGSSITEITGQYRVGDIRHCYADISGLHAATGFEPSVSLEDGLAAFGKWVTNQPLPEDGLDQANRILIEKGLMK
jgi:dTDP-L-rhamnose 4-epimerase